MGRLLKYFINPIVLAVIASSISSVFIVPNIPKYKLEYVNSKNYLNNQLYFVDLDRDTITECIDIHYNYNNVAFPCLCIYRDNSLKIPRIFESQVNWEKRWIRETSAMFGDYDNNRMSEIYIYATRNDSLFLLCIEPIEEEKVLYEKHICEVTFRNDFPDFTITNGGLADLNNDGYKEVIFMLSGGFCLDPRAIFAYDYKNDSIWKSNYEYAFLFKNLKISPKSKKGYFITSNSMSTSNYTKTESGKLPDTCSWFMVFDNNLQFAFPPVENKGFKTYSQSIPILEDSAIYIYALLNQANPDEFGYLMKTTSDGKILFRNNIHGKHYTILFSVKEDNDEVIYLYNITDKVIARLHDDLKYNDVKNNIRLNSSLHLLDIDRDGSQEVVCFLEETHEIVIYRSDFSAVASVVLPVNIKASNYYFTVNSCNFKDKTPNLFIQLADNSFFFNYKFNPKYYYKYLFISGIFLGFLLFFYIVLKLQERIVMKKYEQERKMTELELLTIKNQIDPHFTFNAINTLSSIIYKEDKKTAHGFLVDVSALIRSTLKNSKKISVTLGDEIEFVQNYLRLQQFRYGDKFIFNVNVGDDIDRSMLVPRMIIQTFTENAVKHGLSNKEGKGTINIEISKEGDQLNISVTDDGIGRKLSKGFSKLSTGKGFEIIDQIIALYDRLLKTKVKYEVVDLYHSDGNAAGTMVKIYIPIIS